MYSSEITFNINFKVVSTICIFNGIKLDIVLYTPFDTSCCECWFQAVAYQFKIEWHTSEKKKEKGTWITSLWI